VRSILPVPRAGHPSSARELPAALLLLADADADALADRLHDDLLQVLVVARYAADAAVRGGDPTVTRDAVQEALVALRRTVWQLRPRTGPGLVSALDALSLQRVAARLPAPELHLDGEVAAQLDAAGAAAAYRLVQAALAAAGQRTVVVRLTCSEDRALLDLDVSVPDPRAWSLRARATGGQIVVGRDRVRLLLPLVDPFDRSVPSSALTERDLSDLDREAAP
jgi:hypothetical protein